MDTLPVIPHDVPDLVVLATRLRVRTAPSTLGHDTRRMLRKGDVVKVIDVVEHDDGDVWAQIGWHQFCAMYYRGSALCEFLPIAPDAKSGVL